MTWRRPEVLIRLSNSNPTMPCPSAVRRSTSPQRRRGRIHQVFNKAIEVETRTDVIYKSAMELARTYHKEFGDTSEAIRFTRRRTKPFPSGGAAGSP